jgi:hypothetical protein
MHAILSFPKKPDEMRVKNEIRNSFVQMVMHTYTAFRFEISRKSFICSSNFTKMPLGSVALLTWTMSLSRSNMFCIICNPDSPQFS